MQQMSMFWLRVAVACYSLGLVHVLLLVLRRQSRLLGPALASFCVAVVLHGVSLTESAFAQHSFPARNFYEAMSMCAFLIALLLLWVYWRYQFSGISLFLFPSVFVMTLIGAMEFPVAHWTNPNIRDAWLLLHILLVLVGYAALALTLVASVFYLIQERQLKRKQTVLFFDHLPPLGVLDDLISRSMGWGFVFITLSIIAGSTWAYIESGTRWIGAPIVGISFLTWAFYLLMVFLRISAGWRGRKAAFMVIAVAGCSAMAWVAHIGLLSRLTQ